MEACKACNKAFSRSERTVLCSGFCGKTFHPACAGLNVTNLKAWTAGVGLLWFCEVCRVDFNPIVMDRETLILKTLRDLLTRMDSIDLRVGQFGENLKTINGLIAVNPLTRRESNFSNRLQQFLSTEPTHASGDFHNSIDRLNLDSSLRSSLANQSIDRLNSSLHSNIANRTIVGEDEIPETAESEHVSADEMPENATPIATAVTQNSTAAAANTAPATTNSSVSRSAPALSVSTESGASTSSAGTNGRSTRNGREQRNYPTNRQNPSSAQTQTACRLRVVSRNRQRPNQPAADEALKSFYVTPFQVEQTEEDIIEYLRETTNIENSRVRCTKLVPRNRSTEEMTFVSFKVSVSEDLESIVKDAFYWPDGVEVREFQPKNSKGPQQLNKT